jgi:hypothetical protein
VWEIVLGQYGSNAAVLQAKLFCVISWEECSSKKMCQKKWAMKSGRVKGGEIHWKKLSKSGGLLVNRHKSLTLAIK